MKSTPSAYHAARTVRKNFFQLFSTPQDDPDSRGRLRPSPSARGRSRGRGVDRGHRPRRLSQGPRNFRNAILHIRFERVRRWRAAFPVPGCAGVSPASREARKGRGRRDAGAPRQFTADRDREGPRPGRRAPGSTALPTSPLPGGRSEDGVSSAIALLCPSGQSRLEILRRPGGSTPTPRSAP